MTREEAIRLLTNIKGYTHITLYEWLDVEKEAVDMAIEALSAEAEWIGYNADKEDWLRTDGTPIFLVCDKCHGTVINNGSAHWNFCPNCGARMKRGAE